MPTKEELLEKHTHKLEGYSTYKRVYYSLRKETDKDLSKVPTIKFLALLTKKMEEKGILSEAEIDDLLLDAVY